MGQPAVILIDQLKEICIDAVLEPVETANCFPKIYRKGYTIAINGTESGVDDPDQQFYENFVCGAMRNYTGYCNPEVDKLIDQQSAEPTAKNASSWCGRSRGGSPRRALARSSSIRAAAPAFSPTSRAS